MKRYVVSEVDRDGSAWAVGRRNGYASVDAALDVAENHSRDNPTKTYRVDLFEIHGDSRDHVETLEYFEHQPD